MSTASAPSPLEARLRREIEGGVLFDAFSRGRYATDASIYQIMPIGVVLPRTEEDLVRTVAIARDFGAPVIARGAGTSQSGQTIGRALVVDTSRHLHRILDLDLDRRRIAVQPGVVLDQLNAALQPHGLCFPIDVATANRATLGGMVGNNSAGARSIRYGMTVDHVHAVDAVLADGRQLRFGPVAGAEDENERRRELVAIARQLHRREADEIARRTPAVLRRVAGYNLDRVSPDGFNMASLLAGSEGTLALFSRLHLDLQPLPRHRVLGVCHFPSLRAAAEATRHLVELEPVAVELLDDTLLDLARGHPDFAAAARRFVRGEPRASLLVELAGDDRGALSATLERLEEVMGDLGHPGQVVRAIEPGLQRQIWSVRKAALNIVMSMKGDGKPVSFIEDCAVPLDRLGEYTDRLTELFTRHGTRGTWYAHASVGCLHVRPILNLKLDSEVKAMRAIAEEALAIVRELGGSFSGEHGDGLVRSEFIEPMLGPRLTRAFEELKAAFDPAGLLNPGKIVRPPRMDDRRLLRYPEGYGEQPRRWELDWSAWGGFSGAVEMCNNNGACRKAGPGVMCPSYRVTLDEQHTTRGRANTLRLAITGQLGAEALTADAMKETMDLCVGCKGCRRECPTGVDMARMKIELLHHYHRRHGLPLRERLVAYLPRYAPWATRLAPLLNLRNASPRLRRWGERLTGLSARRRLPEWRRDTFRPPSHEEAEGEGPEVVLWVDTFNLYFEPDNARAATAVLRAAGYRVRFATPVDGGRPLCCGRTFLAAGLVDEARAELRRVIDALDPLAERGIPVVGLEPSCLLTLRDEVFALFPRQRVAVLAERALLLEELLAKPLPVGRLELRPTTIRRAVVHPHCHQRAFGLDEATAEALRRIPELTVETLPSGCCGMAGAFGYEAEHHDLSLRMAELELLPAIRAAPDAALVASGTSCRRQIEDGSGRAALHPARLLDRALPAQGPQQPGRSAS